MITKIILEDGYNTDYIYSLLLSLFYSTTSSINYIINNDTENHNTYYIQEYIKSKFIYPIQNNISIESNIVNKLRLFSYNCGWLRDESNDLLSKSKINKFYLFLINKMMEYNLEFIVENKDTNITNNMNIDIINITNEHLYGDSKVVNITKLFDNWINNNIKKNNNSYKFNKLPILLPIFLDIRDKNTNLNTRYVNVMEGIKFKDINDKHYKTYVWEINSLLCENQNGEYYSIVKNNNDIWIAFSDKSIPSNWIVDMTNMATVKKIMLEIRFIFYKL